MIFIRLRVVKIGLGELLAAYGILLRIAIHVPSTGKASRAT